MREPTHHDIVRLYDAHERLHGFLRMMWSIDCMHWAWAKLSLAYRGQFTRGDHGYPTIMLEVVASYDNWILHAYFGVTDSNNDISALDNSDLFKSLLNEEMSDIPYIVNDVEYRRGYYLDDEIYPTWSAFVKSYSSIVDPTLAYFSKKQAGV
ncbi:uncharacterized protein [Rutidosis leptorrhynchoides]|uniref:uncharacterized protein n=1 Tax=Rutidosis leptorrhynchoides TaxID=125765 RepID=UPI003A9A027A